MAAPSPSPALPPAPLIDGLIAVALEEDRGRGDVTSETLVPAEARAEARLVAKEDGVLAGAPIFAAVFRACDPGVRVEWAVEEGQRVDRGGELARISGSARALLLAERTALNLLQRLSGIATRTAGLVDLVADVPGVRILDTRKTTPGLRALEKYAVAVGGGENHRFGLFDQALIKENHLALSGGGPEEAVARLRAAGGKELFITCEAADAEEARAAVRGGADVVMLDNMSPPAMAELCPELRALAAELGRTIEVEASGGVDEGTVLEIARSGVDRISVGALTHSAPSLDLSLYLEPVSQE